MFSVLFGLPKVMLQLEKYSESGSGFGGYPPSLSHLVYLLVPEKFLWISPLFISRHLPVLSVRTMCPLTFYRIRILTWILQFFSAEVFLYSTYPAPLLPTRHTSLGSTSLPDRLAKLHARKPHFFIWSIKTKTTPGGHRCSLFSSNWFLLWQFRHFWYLPLSLL